MENLEGPRAAAGGQAGFDPGRDPGVKRNRERERERARCFGPPLPSPRWFVVVVVGVIPSLIPLPPSLPPDHHRAAVRVQNQDEGRSAIGQRRRGVSEGGRRCRPQRPSKDRWPREAGEGGEGTFAAAQLSAIMIVMNMYDFVGGRGEVR